MTVREGLADAGEALLSPNWYRVAQVKPRLRGHVRIHRHVYRNQVWYVVEDRISGKFHRFNPASYKVVSLLDGRRDMQAVWAKIVADLADGTPGQDEVIALLGQMYNADLVQCDVRPDLAELFRRGDKKRRQISLGRFANPISIRIPLFDPDTYLEPVVRTLPFLGNYWGLLLWLAVVLPALALVPAHWRELTENFGEQLLTADNLLLMAVIFPIVKALHEFGHAIACKIRGGEVHEMGLMLLVFFPAPYVDVSSASAFSNKWQRMLVGAAGMLTEMFVGALCFYLWLALEPGLLRSLAYNTVVLASVTTVLFNANPLLRYDGYYIFADWLESPNLGGRATQYWSYLARHYLLGDKRFVCPAMAPGERYWFLAYEPLAFAYRLFVMLSIAWFVAQQYFFLGVLIAIWGLCVSLVLPSVKSLRQIMSGAVFAQGGRWRPASILGGGALLLMVFLWAVPLPLHTTVEGVVWPADDAMLKVQASGFMGRFLVSPGAHIGVGQAIAESVDPEIETKILAQTAKVEEAQAKCDAAFGEDPAKTLQLQEGLGQERAVLAKLQDDKSHLILHSQSEGIFWAPHPEDMQGQWLTKGDLVGYVENGGVPRVRVVVHQHDIDQVRLATQAVEIKLAQNLADTLSATIIRAVPAADKKLPSSALGQLGGGDITLDPKDDQGLQTLQSFFELELALADKLPRQYFGSRVYVRFQHPAEAVGFRLWRLVRRLFLSQFLL